MPQIKQTLSPTRANRLTFSLQKLIIMAQVIEYEHVNELDIDFKIPHLNNFARRIGGDAEAIKNHLMRSGKLVPRDYEAVEEYSSEIWRVLDLLIGLPLENIREFADSLGKELVR